MLQSSSPTRWLWLCVLPLSLSACSWFSSSAKPEYQQSETIKPLEVPPDLTAIPDKDELRLPKSVAGSSTGTAGANTSGATNQAGQTAVRKANAEQTANQATPAQYKLEYGQNIFMEKDGVNRWLVIKKPPENLWTQLQTFWRDQGFEIKTDRPDAGLLETDWAKDSPKKTREGLSSLLSMLASSLTDDGTRNRYIMRVESSGDNANIFISHLAVSEVATDRNNTEFRWVAQPNNPEFEAKMLSLLAAKLANRPPPTMVADKDQGLKTTEAGVPLKEFGNNARIEWLTPEKTALKVLDKFDRAWQRTVQALDRGGFTVEDRDRSRGQFFIRYLDPEADQNKGFFENVFRNDKDKIKATRFVISLKNNDPDPSVLTVSSSEAGVDPLSSQRILKVLAENLK